MAEAAEVRVVTAAEALPLRHAVLRAGRPIKSAMFAGDDAPTTRHFAAFQNGQLLSIASIYRAEMPEHRGHSAMQLRGMATAPAARGKGFGKALVAACIAFARDNGIRLLWCNARKEAAGFYKKLGFEIVGKEFDIPDVGPHFRMMFRIPTQTGSA